MEYAFSMGRKQQSLAAPRPLKRKAEGDLAISASAPAPKRRTPQAQLNWGAAPADDVSFADRFSLSSAVLGAGQFGTVRECADRCTGEAFACKTVARAEAQSTEVELMRRLQGHDNVVQLRGVHEDQQGAHLVMDLCRGGDLFDEVVRRGRFAEADAAVLFSELISAVAFCHSNGIMHRDLKPENILLTRPLEQGVPLAEQVAQGPITKLADFGLATAVTPQQTVTGVAGSPFYIAPEVLSGEYNSKADVWSLGVILYVLLTGRPPFRGPTDTDTFEAILTSAPDLTSHTWAGISVEAKSLVRCLLNKDPARRPSIHKILTHPWFAREMRRVASAGSQAQAQCIPVA